MGYKKNIKPENNSRQGRREFDKLKKKKVVEKQPKSKPEVAKTTTLKDDSIRLNKYLAHAGICSRREADTLIQAGAVQVNGEVVTELGHKIKPTDKVVYGGDLLHSEKLVYVLLNKPKNFITTNEDELGRKTVSELVANATKERLYPVGRLDRNTTGVLLFTNDGDLAKKLLHPKHNIKKMYQVTLDKNVSGTDLETILKGIHLEDGLVKADDVSFVVGGDKKTIGIELHSGKNRIVRRIFEHLGYEVVKLDRVSFAGLTKKNLPRGKYRLLTEKEIAFLKML